MLIRVSPQQKMKLLLFDIDGTLIRSNRAGRLAMQAALEELYGTAGPLDTYSMGGKTDARIITDLLTVVGIPPAKIEAQLPLVYDCMAGKAAEIYPNKEIMMCAGVPELLAALHLRQDVMLGLLTGNARPTASLKLMAADINFKQFRVGAYGSEALDRNVLPAIAMQRANVLVSTSSNRALANSVLAGERFTGDNTVIIGDTPADILCARAGKAAAVAVATGWHAAQTLAKYSPDFLFENLADTKSVLSALLGDV